MRLGRTRSTRVHDASLALALSDDPPYVIDPTYSPCFTFVFADSGPPCILLFMKDKLLSSIMSKQLNQTA